MKNIPDMKLLTIAVALIVAAMIPQQNFAQRFNHAGGGGFHPAPSMPAARPAPAPMPQRRVEMPAVQQAPRQTINGGTRNFGNHDFNRPVENMHQNEVHRDVREHVNVYHTNGIRNLRPYAFHPYHPYYWGPHWHPFGFFLSALTANAIRISIANQYYYYDDGCYYLPSNGGYDVVAPPIGAVISYLPDGYETIDLDDGEYYYYAGAFYISTGNGYQVVPAPPGAIVSQLPDGATSQNVNGETLFVYNNTYYAPISQDGQDAYQVVPVN
jgi:hypothetical protein